MADPEESYKTLVPYGTLGCEQLDAMTINRIALDIIARCSLQPKIDFDRDLSCVYDLKSGELQKIFKAVKRSVRAFIEPRGGEVEPAKAITPTTKSKWEAICSEEKARGRTAHENLDEQGCAIILILLIEGRLDLAERFLSVVNYTQDLNRRAAFRASRKAALGRLGIYALASTPLVGVAVAWVAGPTVGGLAGLAAFILVCFHLPSDADSM